MLYNRQTIEGFKYFKNLSQNKNYIIKPFYLVVYIMVDLNIS